MTLPVSKGLIVLMWFWVDSKNGFLNRRLGSFFFIAEVLIDIE
jgi:hypothetical protein